MDSTNQQDTNIGAWALDSRGKFRHVVGSRRQPSRGIVYQTLCDEHVAQPASTPERVAKVVQAHNAKD